MAKFWTGLSVFEYTWDQVAQAFWCRYPNPYSKHVLTEDTVFREVRDNKLYTKRFLTKTNHLPKWGERIVSARSVWIVEESIVDPLNKSITTYTRNIGLQSLMTVEERCVYTEDDCQLTKCDRQAWVDSQIYGLSRPIRMFGFERFKSNVQKALKGFHFALERHFPASDQLAISSPYMDKKKQLVAAGEKAKAAGEKAKDIAKRKAKEMAPIAVA